MGILDELKSDGMKTLAMLGGILAFVVLFLAWSSMGTVGLILLLVAVAVIGGLVLAWKSGWIG